ncbi:MAG: hypothetical protein WC435_02255 [Candidatus Paceibacterota bacterium]
MNNQLKKRSLIGFVMILTIASKSSKKGLIANLPAGRQEFFQNCWRYY